MSFLIFLNGGVVVKRHKASLLHAWAYARRVFGNNLREVRALGSQRIAA